MAFQKGFGVNCPSHIPSFTLPSYQSPYLILLFQFCLYLIMTLNYNSPSLEDPLYLILFV